MFASRTFIAVAALGLLAGCGGGSGNEGKAKSFEEALGLDQASLQARQAKVEEQIRACMKDQGFDYIPQDTSQMGMRVSFGPGGEQQDPKFRRTKGYGITTTLSDEPGTRGPSENDDPNEEIRNALNEEDKKAYDIALHGESRQEPGEGGRTGGVIMRREVGGSGEGPQLDQMGCFGKAQQEVPGGPATIGPSIKEMMERVESDPRLVRANAAWATCMSGAGFGQFEKPQSIPDYLFTKLQELTNSTDGSVRIDENVDQVALGSLQHEELAMARADDDCARRTGRTKIETQVREEAQQRFLDEHPDLTGK
jgi:hypothetical protein